MVLVDLHLHTTASDGNLSPKDLVHQAAKNGLKVISITDHDSTEGITEALETCKSYPEIEVIPGIELSADIPEKEIHMLGYFVEYQNPDLQKQLKNFRMGREERGLLMVNRLRELGIHVEWSRVQEIAGDAAIGRPHIAHAMVEKGYIQYPQEAFQGYLERTGPAYIERPKLSPNDCIAMILRFGGLPVLAHPLETETPESVIVELAEAGLKGIEIYYGAYTPQQIQYLLGIANNCGLIACGGSDYHAFNTPGEVGLGQVGPPIDTIHSLKDVHRSLHPEL